MEKLLTSEQVAERWGMSAGSINNWRKKHRRKGPPFVKFGKGAHATVRYRLEDILAYEKAHLKVMK